MEKRFLILSMALLGGAAAIGAFGAYKVFAPAPHKAPASTTDDDAGEAPQNALRRSPAPLVLGVSERLNRLP